MEPDVMVHLMTGFLDSGKTQFLKFTLEQEYFQIDGTTLDPFVKKGRKNIVRDVKRASYCNGNN